MTVSYIGAQPDEMEAIVIRPAEGRDRERLLAMRRDLWPDMSEEEHEADLDALMRGVGYGPSPHVILVAEGPSGTLAGFLDVGLRSHADGCDPSLPAGYVEGWYVEAGWRRRGVGARLMAEAERWARSHGCREMASDTWLDNEGSQRAHLALGFEVVDRCVHFRKPL